MRGLERSTPPSWQASGGTRKEHSQALNSQYTPDIEVVAENHHGRKISDGRYGPRWMIRCPIHEDRNASAIIFEGDGGGIGVHCYAGCDHKALRDALGLNVQRIDSPQRRGPSLQELRSEAIRHAVAGTKPERWPPFTRSLPRSGAVRILVSGTFEGARCLHALLLPSGHPPNAYRWPVRGRAVSLEDAAQEPTVMDFHRCGMNWWASPYHWAADRKQWLRAFALILIQDWGALAVTVTSAADVATYKPRRFSNAA